MVFAFSLREKSVPKLTRPLLPEMNRSKVCQAKKMLSASASAGNGGEALLFTEQM